MPIVVQATPTTGYFLTHRDLEYFAMKHHLVAYIEVFYSVEQVILGSGQRDTMPSDKCPYKEGPSG